MEIASPVLPKGPLRRSATLTTLVLVGNAKQPFHRLLDTVKNVAPTLPQPIIVQHGNTPFHAGGCESHAFLDREGLVELMCGSKLIICHAGAGCVIDALSSGHVPLIMPRRRALGEHIDDHQLEFAQMLHEVGKAVVVEDARDMETAVQQALAMGISAGRVEDQPSLVGLIRERLSALALKLSGTP